LLQCTYECSVGKCNFSKCLLAIQKNPKLLKWRTREVCEEIVKDIDSNQDDFLPAEVDGFYINRMGHELVHLKRKDCKSDQVSGFVEYNDLRKQSMAYYDVRKVMCQYPVCWLKQ
jgi:hypothetical protein